MGSVISVIAPSESNHYKTTAVVASSAILAAAHFSPDNTSNDGLVNLAHLSSFAIWFGTQFWVTAVAGLISF